LKPFLSCHFNHTPTFFGAFPTHFSALLVKRTNPFITRTQHIGGSESDYCTLMVELNAPNALRYFGGMQTFEGAVITR